jgi:hypothetical protein
VGVALLCSMGFDSHAYKYGNCPTLIFFKTPLHRDSAGKTKKMKKILLSVFALLALAGSGTAQQWSFKAPMSVKRASAGATVFNGFIYVIGGTCPDSSETLRLNERYNPATNSWNVLAPMPTPRVEFGLATVSGKIYAIGGGNTTGPLNVVEEYNPVNNTWTSKTPMPTPRSTTSVTVINNLIYCAGDWPNATGVFEVYNPATDTWTTGSPMLQGRMNTYSFCSANGLGYFIGGKNSAGSVLASGEIYNPSNNTWTPMPESLPDARWAGTCVELNGKIHYLGGSSTNNYAPTTSNFVFNLSNNQWTIGDTMNIARADFSSAIFNGKIYVFGGKNTNTQSTFNSVEEYSVFSANCPTFPASLAQGLVGYWPFCGNALDESGNNNHGTVNGATLTTDRFGNAGSAYGFDGEQNFIRVENSSSISIQGSVSISAWVLLPNSNLIGEPQGIVTKWYYSGFDVCNGQKFDSYTLVTYDADSSGVTNFTGSTNANSISGNQVVGTDIQNDSIWKHLVYTHDSSSGGYLYVNGVQIASQSTTGDICPSTNPLLFGADNNNGNIYRFLKGQLDDIAIWNRALTPQEIQQVYNQGICQTSITVTDTLLIHTGITSYNPVAYQNTVKVWPNPGNTAITLDAGNLALMQGWKIRISNAQGAQIYPATGQSGLISQQQQTLNMSDWGGNGLYFLYLIDPQNNIQEVKKIVLAP